jgi:LmbE family N-acetylglucosaminyl deacetylase
MRSIVAAALAAVTLAAVTARERAAAQLSPLAYDRGATGLGLALRRLTVTARVLYVTAHPDDEHNGVLVRLSRGRGVRTALLTLTRGEGGQNEIGPELFQALGVLRTEELAAVHRYDAAEQYFGRAFEFGYSYSVEETLERWGREATLADVVRVVRSFRPDVILTLPLEASGGGMHHQAASRLAVDAFRAAAGADRYLDQIRAGLRPWQAAKIYQGGTGGEAERLPGATPVAVDTGVYDPLLGMTWQELGSIARSSHKCQGSNQLKASPGTGQGLYSLVDSEPKVQAAESDILASVDLSVKGLTRFARGEEGKAPFLAAGLAEVQDRFEDAVRAFDPGAPERTVPPLVAGLTALRRLRDQVKASGLSAGAREELLDRLDQKEHEVLAALPLAHGLTMEVVSRERCRSASTT